MCRISASTGQVPNGESCAGASKAGMRACKAQAPRRPKAGAGPLLTAVVVAVALGYTSLEPAQARQCSAREAERIAVSQYGGEALSVRSEGEYLIVRLRLGDGRVIDVAISRGRC